jgi:hypothetical protein
MIARNWLRISYCLMNDDAAIAGSIIISDQKQIQLKIRINK